MTPYKIDLVGHRYGKTTVLSFIGRDPKWPSNMLWLCRCDCGVEHIARAGNLRSGNTASCGCLHSGGRAVERHGAHNSRTYATWEHMVQRGTGRATGRSAKLYKGITVCDRWRMSFTDFLADMGERPDGMTLDRINPDKGYDPSNCRWATPLQQGRNTKTTRRIGLGSDEAAVGDLADLFGIKTATVNSRIKAGWHPIAAVTTPLLAPGRRAVA